MPREKAPIQARAQNVPMQSHRRAVTNANFAEVEIKMADTVSGVADTAAPCLGDAEGFDEIKKESRIYSAAPKLQQFNSVGWFLLGFICRNLSHFPTNPLMPTHTLTTRARKQPHYKASSFQFQSRWFFSYLRQY